MRDHRISRQCGNDLAWRCVMITTYPARISAGRLQRECITSPAMAPISARSRCGPSRQALLRAAAPGTVHAIPAIAFLSCQRAYGRAAVSRAVLIEADDAAPCPADGDPAGGLPSGRRRRGNETPRRSATSRTPTPPPASLPRRFIRRPRVGGYRAHVDGRIIGASRPGRTSGRRAPGDRVLHGYGYYQGTLKVSTVREITFVSLNVMAGLPLTVSARGRQARDLVVLRADGELGRPGNGPSFASGGGLAKARALR